MKRLIWTLLFAVSALPAPQGPFTAPVQKPEFDDIQASSLYVPVRDSVRIAIDVLLPKGL